MKNNLINLTSFGCCCVQTVAYLNMGTSLIALGRCHEAASILRQGSKLDGNGLRDRTAHNNARISMLLQLGSLYVDQGKLQRALAVYRETLHSLPKNYPPQVYIVQYYVSESIHNVFRMQTKSIFDLPNFIQTIRIGYLSSLGRHTSTFTSMVRSRTFSSGSIRSSTGSCCHTCIVWHNVGKKCKWIDFIDL